MTDPTTNSKTSPTKASRRTYASYSAATAYNNNNNDNNSNKGDTPSTVSTNESSPLNNKDLSVKEMTRDLFQSLDDTGRKSGIDWSFGDSDGEDNDITSNSKSNNNSVDGTAEEEDDNVNNSEKETGLPATPASVTKPAISDSDTASMSGEDETETPEKSNGTSTKEIVETPSPAAADNESIMEIENESNMEKETSNDDASETVQPEQSEVSIEDKDVTNALKTKECNPEQENGDSDNDATVALDMEEDDDETTAKPETSLFDIDLSDQEEEDDPANDAENAASDDEEVSSKPTKRGRTKRKPKKKLPVQKTIPEDSDSEQEFDDARETSPAAAAAAEKEQPTEDVMEASPTPAEKEQDVADGDEADVEDNGRRRSRRTPKKRNLDFVPPEPSPRKTSTKSKKDKQKKKKKKTKGGQQPEPEQDQLLTSTDYLFLQADKTSVTVKDILKALEAEFECKLSKASRKFVRGHLVALMSEEVQPSISLGDNDGKPANDEEEEENVGEEEEEEDQISEQGDVESEFEADEMSEDDEDFGAKSKRKSKKKSSSPKSKVQKKKKKDARPKPKRPNQRKAAKAARLVEAMRLRKKRMEELRVRNEEMQLNQTKEDQARAEKIAAKLDTNTDELRIQRLEDRLDLLGKLDQKRIVVLLEEDTLLSDLKKEPTEEGKENGKTEIKDEGDASKPAEADSEEEDSEEESSDEEDLVIVGATRRIKPMAPLSAHVKATAIEVLNRLKSPDRKQQLKKQHQQLTQQTQLAPANNMRARSALRRSLKQKQRSMSNTWLARELGYKTEQEHLKDCEEAANKKRGLTILREQQRIQSNERKHLRERLMVQVAPVAYDDDDDDEEKEANLEETSAAKAEQEDEEMQMAKEVEKEQAAKVASEEEPESTESQALKNTESQVPAASPVKVTEESTSSKEDSEETSIPSPPEEKDDTEDFSPDFSQEEEAQPFESQLPELPDTETQTETPRPETQLLPPAAASTDEDTQEETQRLETQVPPSAQKMPPPAAVVHKVTTEAGVELSQLSDGVDEESPKQDAVPPTEAAEKSTDSKPEATEGKDFEDGEDDGELEFVEEKQEKSKQDRNSAWKMMLQKEAEKYKKQKKRRGGNGLVEQEAEEEEEEEVAGLEDFGFSVKKKKNGEDDDEDPDSLKMDQDDLEHIVDDVSDGEGDEEAGRIARKKQELREEKERHKDMIRRMREGYDGRRGGIAGSGVGARGIHRFDQLVAADNREDAKRLGLLNEDELDSDDENNENKKGDADVEDDEAALLDEMLKDRFLHRSNVELENFSDDDDEDDEKESEETKGESVLYIFFRVQSNLNETPLPS
ncbi:MAG: hypothetical protein SGBAC_006434 [Bacillariaceae sp.]